MADVNVKESRRSVGHPQRYWSLKFASEDGQIHDQNRDYAGAQAKSDPVESALRASWT